METVVSFVCDRTKLNRKLACLLVFLLCIVLGIPSALGNGVTGVWDSVKLLGFSFLDFFDFISNSVLMPICAFITCIFVGYVIKPQALIDEVEINGAFKRKSLFSVIIKYVAPVCIVLILVYSILTAFGIVSV
jgi:NSS family neurotransmitter:Na+ symporter